MNPFNYFPLKTQLDSDSQNIMSFLEAIFFYLATKTAVLNRDALKQIKTPI